MWAHADICVKENNGHHAVASCLGCTVSILSHSGYTVSSNVNYKWCSAIGVIKGTCVISLKDTTNGDRNWEVTHKSLHITSVLYKMWLRFDPPQVSMKVFVDIVPFKESQFTRQSYLQRLQTAIFGQASVTPICLNREVLKLFSKLHNKSVTKSDMNCPINVFLKANLLSLLQQMCMCSPKHD